MTDSAVEGQPSDEQGSTATTAGDLLRQARERQQVDIAVLASVLKVPEQKIHALEHNQLDALPDLAFARSLASSMARILQIDPAPVLALLPKVRPSALREAHDAINAPYQPQTESGALSRAATTLQSRYLWVVLALLLAAAVLAMLPQLRESQEAASANGEGSFTSGTVTRQVAEPLDVQTPAAPTTVASDGALIGAPPLPSAATASAPEAVASVAEVASAPEAGSGDLLFTTAQESWIQVQEAGGKTLLSRTLRAGESVPLTGTAPYKVVVGNITGVTLTVRGQAFDLAGAAKGGTTARFVVP